MSSGMELGTQNLPQSSSQMAGEWDQACSGQGMTGTFDPLVIRKLVFTCYTQPSVGSQERGEMLFKCNFKTKPILPARCAADFLMGSISYSPTH